MSPDGRATTWPQVRDVGPSLRKRFVAAGVSPDVVARWCPWGDRTPGNVYGATGWTPRRLVKFVESVNSLSDLDGAVVLERAVQIGLAADRESANAWQDLAERDPVGWAQGVMGTSSRAAFELWWWSRRVVQAAAPVSPDTAEARRVAGLWVQGAGAFKSGDAEGWARHPAAHLGAPECPFTHEGWAEFGSFVPWMVSAGYTPSNAPRQMGGPRAGEAVALVTAAVEGWDTGVPDASVRWWADDWYRGVGIGAEAAALFRAAGWEPPLAAFMLRWAGRVQAKTVLRRFADAPVSLLRRVWRSGGQGLFLDESSRLTMVSQRRFSFALATLGADRFGAWLDRFGSVGVVCRLVDWGVEDGVLRRVDARWPGHGLFRWMNGMGPATGGDADWGGWLLVALATHPQGEPLSPDAHLGVSELMPGWVGDFIAAGVVDPDEALRLVETGTSREALALLGALRA